MSRLVSLNLGLCALVGLAVLVGCQPSPTPKAKEKPKATSSKPADTKAAEIKTELPKPEEKKADAPKPQEAKADAPKPEKKPAAEEKKEAPREEPKPAMTPEEKKEEPKLEKKDASKDEPKAEKKDAPKEEPKPAMTPEGKKEEPKAEKKEAKSADEACKPLKKPELLVELPDYCNTPDGMALLSDGSVIVAVPNFNDKSASPLLVKITKDNKVEDFLKLPKHPDTGRMGPMGIRQAPNGDLYLADNQIFHGKDGKNLMGKSRLIRIPMKDGKPGELEVMVTGINVANGMAIQGGYVYLTETVLVPDSKPLVSGVYRFKLDEKGVKMQTPLEKDPHLVLKVESPGNIGFGADGICFDSRDNLYVNCFEGAWIRKIKLDADGKVQSNEVFAKDDCMKSCDGMDYDPKTDKIYVADLVGNSVFAVSMDGKVQRLAGSPDNDGSGGQLDAPCEALVRGNTIVVANMDFPFPGTVDTKTDKPYTISVIKLD